MSTPIDRPFLSVIVPAYNEEKRISTTLHAIYDYLSQQHFEWEVLIVIDGASDDTIGKVTAFAEGRSHISWIDREENRGKGYTVRQGMLAATGQYRLFTDADNSTDISHLDLMLPLLQADKDAGQDSGKDIVICSRDSKDAPEAKQAVPQPFSKRLLGNLGNLLIQILAVPGIWDTQCGFKVYSAEATEAIFPYTQIEGWGFDVEALALARRHNFSIAIVPAHWIDDPRTNVRSLWDYVESLGELFRIRWNLMTGVYNQPVKPAIALETDNCR